MHSVGGCAQQAPGFPTPCHPSTATTVSLHATPLCPTVLSSLTHTALFPGTTHPQRPHRVLSQAHTSHVSLLELKTQAGETLKTQTEPSYLSPGGPGRCKVT